MAATFSNASCCAGGEGHCCVIEKRKPHALQVFPITLHADNQDSQISQRLLDAVHLNDLQLSLEILSHPSTVDVNFIGTVCFRSRKTEVVLNAESAIQVRVELEELRTDVTALFLAAHNGNLALVVQLLNFGANVNQKVFRGYATTAAVREGHVEVLEMLLKRGASQAACEEALLEASYLGRAKPAELLMGSEMIRPHVAVHALVIASSRGFVDFVQTLTENGVDVNANARVLLLSSKPSLHANVDCNALVAAIVSRQITVVQLLLKIGCRTDTKVRLGAWSWDVTTGEEFRVGAGLAEPYSVTWCAVEYFEASGVILRMLLEHLSPNIPHLGRTIIHHAILCGNARAIEVLLSCGSDTGFPIEATKPTECFQPIHLAARLGVTKILDLLINAGCDINSRTGSGETALMICCRHKHGECLKLLAGAGADFGLYDQRGLSAATIAGSVRWTLGFQQAVLDVIQSRKFVRSSNPGAFSSPLTATQANNIVALKESDLKMDVNGGYTETLRLLANAGTVVEARNEREITLAKANQHIQGAFEETSEFVHRAACIVDVDGDEVAWRVVIDGAKLMKHTKAGKGRPHAKVLKMVEETGVLRWGKSCKRNVICRWAEVGASSVFRQNRGKKAEEEEGVFRVITTGNKEIHFCCLEGGSVMAGLWVRGIRLVTQRAIFWKGR